MARHRAGGVRVRCVEPRRAPAVARQGTDAPGVRRRARRGARRAAGPARHRPRGRLDAARRRADDRREDGGRQGGDGRVHRAARPRRERGADGDAAYARHPREGRREARGALALHGAAPFLPPDDRRVLLALRAPDGRRRRPLRLRQVARQGPERQGGQEESHLRGRRGHRRGARGGAGDRRVPEEARRLPQARRPHPQGRAPRRAARHGQDAARQGHRGRGAGPLLRDLRQRLRGDVRRRGREPHARHVRRGEEARAVHRLHRRDRLHRPEAHGRGRARRQPRLRADAQHDARGDGRLRAERRRDRHRGDEPARHARFGAPAARPLRPPGERGAADAQGPHRDPQPARQADQIRAGCRPFARRARHAGLLGRGSREPAQRGGAACDAQETRRRRHGDARGGARQGALGPRAQIGRLLPPRPRDHGLARVGPRAPAAPRQERRSAPQGDDHPARPRARRDDGAAGARRPQPHAVVFPLGARHPLRRTDRREDVHGRVVDRRGAGHPPGDGDRAPDGLHLRHERDVRLPGVPRAQFVFRGGTAARVQRRDVARDRRGSLAADRPRLRRGGKAPERQQGQAVQTGPCAP